MVPHECVIDYGAGYARQSFLFPNKYIATDRVDIPLGLQRWVLNTLYPNDPRIEHYHAEELPDISADLMLFVWSLSEFCRQDAEKAIEYACRNLVKEGHIYIRDNPTHGHFYDKQLISMGFMPVFNAWGGYHGVPRLFRYMPKYMSAVNTTFVKTYRRLTLRLLSPTQIAVAIHRFVKKFI